MSSESLDNISPEALSDEITRGGRLVVFPYCISIIFMTFRRSSGLHLIRQGESALAKGWPFLLISLFLGWWGIPWGLIYTPVCLFQVLAGGKNVTQEIIGSIQVEARRAAAFAPSEGTTTSAITPDEAPPELGGEPSPAAAKNPWAM